MPISSVSLLSIFQFWFFMLEHITKFSNLSTYLSRIIEILEGSPLNVLLHDYFSSNQKLLHFTLVICLLKSKASSLSDEYLFASLSNYLFPFYSRKNVSFEGHLQMTDGTASMINMYTRLFLCSFVFLKRHD